MSPALSRASSASASSTGSRFGAGGTLVVDNPYTGTTYAEVPLADTKQAVAVAEAAEAAQREFWASTTLDDRIALCERFMAAFETIRIEVANDITGQMGKPLAQARGEVDGMYERIRGMISMAPATLGEEVLAPREHIERRIVREPVGTVLVVAPWNYSLLTAANAIFAAVLAGNSVILKHSSRTPLAADAFERAFALAGAPEGLVTALHCSHDVVDEIIQHPSVGFVAFTGSVDGGHSIYRSVSASRFIDTTLELGGKDPAYVAEDARLDAAVETLVDGAFYNAGQSCCAIERVYVHRSLYDQFLEGAQALVSAYSLGDPMLEGTSMGPLAQASAIPFLKGQVDDAVARGARVLCGGSPTHDAAGKGRFFEPTLLADCDHGMSLMVDESFGPVLGVMPVDSDEEALALMNDSPYGLTACLFTQDSDRAAALAPRVSTGTVFMNRCDYLDPELPWTGVRDTGKGVSLSKHGFRGVTRLKSLHFKSLP